MALPFGLKRWLFMLLITSFLQHTLSTTDAPDERDDVILRGAPAGLREGAWVIVLIVCLAIDLLIVVAFECFIMYKLAGTSISLAKIWLGQLLLVAVFLTFLSLFAFVTTETDSSCGIIRFSVGVCYAMIFSVFLVKLLIILSSKHVGYLKGIFQVLMFLFAFGVQLGIDIQWLLLRKPEAQFSHVNDDGDQIWECKQSFESHVISLSYVMFLLVICTLLAVKACRISTNHRESLLILVCCCSSLLIFLGWLCLGFLPSNSDFEDPALAFGLLAIATICLLVMFIPKMYQLTKDGASDVWALEYEESSTCDGYAASILPPSIIPDMLIGGERPVERRAIPVAHLDHVDSKLKRDPFALRHIPDPIYDRGKTQ